MSSSPIDSAYSRSVLGRRLRELRELRRISLRAIAADLQIDPSSWSRIENGDRSVRSLDVERACHVLRVDDQAVVNALMELAKQTKNKSWLSSYDKVVSPNLRHYISLESAAEVFTWYETEFVPSLLQTEDYARAVMALERFNNPDYDPAALAERLEVRMNRQRILDRETDVPQLEIIIRDTALLQNAGSDQTMIGQLEHLLLSSERSNVSLQVLPLGPEHGGRTVGPHLLMDFPPLAEGRLVEPTQVYVDGYSAFYMSADPAEVGKYRRAWPSLREIALSESASREFIRRRIIELS